MNIPFSIANDTIKLPYFSRILLMLQDGVPSLIIEIIESKAFLTNSAGYKAKRFAIRINIAPIMIDTRYLQKNLFKYNSELI